MKYEPKEINKLLQFWYVNNEISFGCMSSGHKCIVKHDEATQTDRFFCTKCGMLDEVKDYHINSLVDFKKQWEKNH